MKKTQMVSVGIAFILAITFILHAQTTTTIQSLHSASTGDMAVLLQAVEATTPVAVESVPVCGTFYSAQFPNWPPLPCNINNVPVWDLGDGVFLLSDLDVNYSQRPMASSLMAGGMRAMSMSLESTSTLESGYEAPVYGSNDLWLEITGVSNGAAWFNLHNSTNQIYAILSTTDLLANWNIEMEVWPTNPAVMPFTVPTLERQNLFLQAEDWTGVTENGNQTPDWWFWEYFGTIALSDTNLDSLGNTLLYDYTNNFDPNVIQFLFQLPDRVTTNAVGGSITLWAGVPFYYAVSVNDTNVADALWQPYAGTNIMAALGATNGTYTVSVGLRGRAPGEAPLWEWTTVILDATPSFLVVTNPVSSVVTKPVIQLQGYASEGLSNLTFDVSNAVGVLADQPGFLAGQFYDTNVLAFTTNYFQCYDIALTNGLNTVTLHATFLTGETVTTNVSFTLDYSGDVAPVIHLIWPQDGVSIGGNTFTLRGILDDLTAQVSVSGLTDEPVNGKVGRDGQFWVENLPLANGDNTLTLMATDAAGNSSTTNITVFAGDVVLAVTPLSDDDLRQPTATVYGTVSDSSYDVWVNGVEVYYVDDEGGWEADGVPVNGNGIAAFDVTAYPPGEAPAMRGYFHPLDDGGGGVAVSQSLVAEMPSMVLVSSYQSQDYYIYMEVHFCDGEETHNSGSDYYSWMPGSSDAPPSPPWPQISESDGGGGFLSEAQAAHCNGTGADSYSYRAQESTSIELAAGGQPQSGEQRLVLLTAQGYDTDYNPISPSSMSILGQSLTPMATDPNSGQVLVASAAGSVQNITPSLPGNGYVNVQPQDVKVQSLTVVSNSATQIDATNWAVVKSPTNDYVVVQATLNYTNDWIVTNAATAIQWTGGEAVPGNPFQRRVSKATSAETTVTATLGSPNLCLNVWVVWANLQITTGSSDTIDSGNDAVKLINHDWPSYLGGGNGLGPIDCISNPNLTYAFTIGKMQAKSTLAPTGIENVITNGWHLHRHAQFIAWDNGLLSASDTGNFTYDDTSDSDWMDQNPKSGTSTREIYDIDGPGCPIHGGTSINHTAEIYDNFKEFVTVTLGGSEQPCSNTNTWSCTAQIDVDKSTNKVELNSVTTSLITLPTSPHYSQR